MEVRCPACAARYNADDEKLRGKTARMRCKACNTVWLVSGAGALAPTDGPPMSVALNSPDASRPPGSRRAAVVKRGAEREKRDLFAERDPDAPVSAPSSMRSSDAPPPSFGFAGGGVGARNETSVLFRVDQLALAKTQPAVAAMVPSSTSSTFHTPRTAHGDNDGPRVADDDGVIDLKALSSRPPRGASAPMGPPVAPLFSEPPPVTLEVDGGLRPNVKPTSRLAIAGIAAGSVVALAAAIFGLSVAFRGEEPVKHTAAVVAPAPPAPPPTATAVTPAPSASVADNADPKDPPKGRRGHGKGRRGAAASGAASAPKTPKAADPCGCHGDFNCVLACSAKGKM